MNIPPNLREAVILECALNLACDSFEDGAPCSYDYDCPFPECCDEDGICDKQEWSSCWRQHFINEATETMRRLEQG